MKGYSFTELAKLVEAAMPRAGGAFSGNVSAPRFIGPLQGNADTATAAGRADKLSTARNITIGSTTKAFDGTENLSWSLAEIGAINASATVAAAHKWATPRALQIGNSSKAVDGTTNVAWSLAEIGAVNKAGDTMTGGLTFSTDSELAWVRNTDYAKIGFKNSSDSDADSYMWFQTGDNGNEYFKWQGISGSTTADWMTLKSSGLTVAGTITAPTFSGALSGNAATATKLATARTLTIGNTGKAFDGTSNVAWSLAEMGVAQARAEVSTGAAASITTKEFVAWLVSVGAFDTRFWFSRGSWSYASNKTIVDTGVGNIHLAGCTIEVMSATTSNYTIRIITPTTTSGGGTTGAEFVYVDNGDNYAPGWRRIYTTAWNPTASDVGLGNVPNTVHTTASTANTVAVRDGAGDVHCRLLRSEFADQTGIAGALAFRINNSNDNYLRFTSDTTAVRNWLGAAPIAYRENWADKGIHTQTSFGIAWRYYGNGHVVCDASSGNIEGISVPRTDAQVAWDNVNGATLVGWNGGQSFGVRVDRARLADAANVAGTADRITGVVSTNGQDLTIHGKRAMVGIGDANQLMLNYGNDWGSTAITGHLYAGSIDSSRHIVFHNGATHYANAGLEIRSTDGSAAILGLHRAGYGSVSVGLHGDGGVEIKRGDGSTRGYLAADWCDSSKYVYVDGGWWVGNHGLTYESNHFTDAPFQVNFGGVPAGSYAPIVSGVAYTNGYGFTTRAKFGMRTHGGWSTAELFVGSGEASAEAGHPRAIYSFDAFGNFYAPGKINCVGDVTTSSGLIGFSAYINGPQQGSANALTRKDYVDGQVASRAPADHSQWRLVAAGDVAVAMANHATGSLRATIDTGIHSAHGFVHDAAKYRAVIYTNDINTTNPAACTWGAYGTLRALARWNGPHTIQLDIYSFGTNMTKGNIYRWEVYEVI